MALNQSRLLVFLVAVAFVHQTLPVARGYASQQPRAVELSKVTAITLFKGQYTAGRRSKGVAQLACTGGCHLYSPVTVQCQNVGSDGRDVQWRCEADMPSSVGFESTQVSCEGYIYPDDPLVLEGSCGLEFSLRRVGVGSGGKGFGFWNPFRGTQQAGARYSDGGHGGFQESAIERGSAGWDAWQLLIGLFVTCVFVYIIWKAIRTFSGGAPRYPPPSSSDTSGRGYPSAPPPPTGSGWFDTGSGYGTGSGEQFQPGYTANNTWDSGSSSRAETTEKSTGYATTKRR